MAEQATTTQEKEDEHGHGALVEVEIDGKPRRIRRGRYEIPELKISLGVPPGYDLELVVNGEFKPLPDSSHMVIHGGEVFVSHVPRGGNS
ncbi:MAG TPA: hypothetical protein VGQ08_17080 [Nitrospiraceae bacterium]|jgi:hypothetical protein|nr:hypothetical protein [Nitrospiraceae bacterium]